MKYKLILKSKEKICDTCGFYQSYDLSLLGEMPYDEDYWESWNYWEGDDHMGGMPCIVSELGSIHYFRDFAQGIAAALITLGHTVEFEEVYND